MNSFEEISKHLLEMDGYWVKTGVKVKIKKEVKKELGKPSMPTPEIDLIAFKPLENLLILIECKSYFDSTGVQYKNLEERNLEKDKYKILSWPEYQKAVSKALKDSYVKRGLFNDSTRIQFGLIAGKLKKSDECKIKRLMEDRNWFFWGPDQLFEKVKEMSNDTYADNPYHILSKLILRHKF